MQSDVDVRAENLNKIVAAKGWRPVDLVAKLGRSASFWSDRLSGRRPIGEKLARSIEEGLGLSRYGLDRMPSRGHSVANTSSGPDLRGSVPLISWITAGSWNGAHDPFPAGEAEQWLECPVKHSERTYALRVRGDSMTAAYGRSYPEGCVVFVDPTKKSPVNGARIIAKLDGTDEVTFKVFKQEDGRIWLAPLNPSHEPIRDEFKVLGTVIGKWEDE